MKKNGNQSILETDVVLVYVDNNPTFFARIENISPDYKKGWWRVRLLILQIPLVVTTWILDNDQIRGADFTMGGTPIRIEKVTAPAMPEETITTDQEASQFEGKPQKQARIISLNPSPDKNG